MATADMLTAVRIGLEIGRAMARDAIAEEMDDSWSGLDAQDGDRATQAGIEPGTHEWKAMEAAARIAFGEMIDAARD